MKITVTRVRMIHTENTVIGRLVDSERLSRQNFGRQKNKKPFDFSGAEFRQVGQFYGSLTVGEIKKSGRWT